MATISRSVLCFSIFVAIFSLGHAARIVFMPMFGNSHYFVLKKMAVEMANRGHEVKLLIPSSLEGFVVNSSVSHTIYEAPAFLSQTEENIGKLINDKVTSTVISIFPFAFVLKIQEMTCRSFLKNKKVVNEIKEFKADVVVSDLVFMCGPILQDLLDVPRVDVSPVSIIPFFMQPLQVPSPISYTPQMGTESTDEMSFFQRLHNLAVYVASEALREFFVYKPFDKLKKEFKIRPERSFKETFEDDELILIQADFVVDIPRPLPPTVRMVGPILPEPAQPLPADLEQFMESSGEHGVILVTFGSMLSKLEPAVLKKMSVAFGQLKQKVLWKVKKEFLPSDVSSNIKAVKWLPQNDVLGHKKTRLFISHMGHNGMYEALYHGIPLVGCPLFGDQFSNANLLIRNGAGKWVKLLTIPSDDLVNVITSVLDNSQFKAKAVRMSNLMRDRQRTPVQESADSIEYVLRNGKLPHLRVRSFDIPWYQYYLVDLIIFIVALVTAVVFLLAFFCKCCCNVLCTKGAGKQKAE